MLNGISFYTLIVWAAYLFAGFIDSVCGGGGLITVPALMVIGVPAGLISGTNHAGIIPGSFVSFFTYLKSGKVSMRAAVVTVPFTIIGTLLGARVNMLIPERYLQLFMFAMIPVLTFMLFVKKDFGSENAIDSLSKVKVTLYSALIGIVLGFYQGFYGPGGGTFFLLAFVLLLKLDFVSANGTTRFVAAFSSLTASISYSLSGKVIWDIALAAMILYIAGSYIGAKYAIKCGKKGIRPIMLMVICLLFLKVASGIFH